MCLKFARCFVHIIIEIKLLHVHLFSSRLQILLQFLKMNSNAMFFQMLTTEAGR